MKVIKIKLLTLFALFIFSAERAAAQDDYHKFEFYGGYSNLRAEVGDLSDSSKRIGANGFNASVTGNLRRYFGLKFEYSFHRKITTTVFPDPVFGDFTLKGRAASNTFVGGVQFKDNSKDKRFKPFAHAMLGGQRIAVKATNGSTGEIIDQSSKTYLTGVFGGGLDIRVSRRIDVRVIQFDYNPLRVTSDGTSILFNDFRIGAGIVFH